MIRPKGFTLIEVIIALSLFSVIMSALYGSFFVAERAASGGGEMLVRMHELRTAMDMMEKEISSAAPPKKDMHGFLIKDMDIFGEQASSMDFSTFSSPISGAARCSYYIEEKDDALILYKKIRPAFGDEETAISVEFVEDIKSFTVEAWDGSRWLKTWNAGLPKAVRITITVPLKGRDFTLSETTRPRIGGRL